MKVYSVVDKKSSVAEYFVAGCDEDALRIFSVMMMSSRPMYEFAEDFALYFVHEFPDVRVLTTSDEIVVDGFEVKRILDSRRKEAENAKD